MRSMNQALAPVSSLSPGRRGDKHTKSHSSCDLGAFAADPPHRRESLAICAPKATPLESPPRRPRPSLRRRDLDGKGTMAASVKIDFQPFGTPVGGDLVVFVGDDLKPADAALEIDPKIKDLIASAA